MKESSFVSFLAVFAAATALSQSAVPSVTSITRVGTFNSPALEVSYTLDAPAVVTFELYTNGVPVDATLLGSATGDVFRKVSAGAHAFKWRVAGVLPEEMRIRDGGAVVRVKAWPLGQPPDYMVVDLSEPRGAIAYYDCAGQIPGGVTGAACKTTSLVMRKIPAANLWWRQGCPTNAAGTASAPHATLLSADYYLGVFELTAAQAALLGDVAASDSALPVRDSWNGLSDAIASYSTYAGLSFRMPTSAEWEFACRAGSTNDLHTGEALLGLDTSANLDAIAWYGRNTDGATRREVGLLAPNAWGLYDMLGNVWEWCSDWQGGYGFADQTDPAGPASGTQRIRRGGAFDSPAHRCTAHSILGNAPGNSSDSAAGVGGSLANNQGIRLCAPCEAVR